jgi:OPA family glycerol-3-phosphate transporter-like MFS transporter
MPAPSSPDVTAALDPRFRSRRTQNWLLLGFLYALFYMSRYNYSATSAYLALQLGWTNKDLGVFETTLPLFYGAAVFFNGPIADRVGGKRAFLFGTLGSSAMNFLFGAMIQHTLALHGAGGDTKSMIPILAIVWGINGYFQSFGALSIVKVNAHWFNVRERGTFAGIFGVLIRFGLILAFYGSPLILKFFAVPWVFWIPASLLLVFFVLNFLFMADSPAAAGLGEYDTGEGETDSRPAVLSEVLKKVFASRVAWTVAGASMMLGFVRRSVIDAWWPKYFANVFHVDPKQFASSGPYALTTWGIALAGIAGGFAFGITSDKVFHGRRGPVITFGFIGMACLLIVFGIAHHLGQGPYLAASILIVLSFFVNGAHGMIGGAASMDFGGKKAAATAAGLFDGMQYVAASTIGYGMGALLDSKYGWSGWTFAVVPFALVGVVLGLSLWNAVPKRSAGH